MKHCVFLLGQDHLPAALAAEIVRVGGEPRPLEDAGRIVGYAATVEAAGVAHLRASPLVSRVLEHPVPYPLAARRGTGTRQVEVPLGPERLVLGDRPVVIAGPCAVESEAQLEACARAIAGVGGRFLRGGAYKPRTSPYSFSGDGERALELLRAVADRHRLAVVTEVLDPRDVERVAARADVLQIGARTMSDFALLRAVGATAKPVLLKRAPSATLEEWLLAAEHLLHAGTRDVVLCERGVRGHDPAARNLLDLAAVPLLRARTDLPVFVDPSHGTGVRRAVVPMAAAAIAAGADGVLVECHPDPGSARSDGPQALPLGALPALFGLVSAVAGVTRATLDAAAE